MNSAQVKRIPLIAFLEALHFKPLKIKGNEYWYKSPFREEQTASFSVNNKKNTWFDFGSGQGGNIIDLAGKLFNKTDISEILSIIDDKSRSFSFSPQPAFDVSEKDQEAEILKIAPLTNPALLDYLAGRKVDGRTAQQYSREIYYRVDGKNYFAIGFKNDTGGYEIRNKYFKGCIRPKDTTTIKTGHNLLTIFEGFIDFLSYQEILKGIEYRIFMANSRERTFLKKITPKTDLLILNSAIHLQKAEDTIREYPKLHLFFDNDQTGRVCTTGIEKLGIPYEDFSTYYHNHKDLNDYLKTENNRREQDLGSCRGIRL
ncbi:MAG: hypothetical protein BGN92_03595 [Sphingobacteriales bacterium 41-5]|nr:MAG: hypothetical protein BGN92_03595 [Sphingobacteriales bacterium 41-5]